MRQYQIWFLWVLFLVTGGDAENLSGLEDDINQDLFNIVNHLKLPAQDLGNQSVTADKIFYYLYTSKSPQNSITIDASNANSLRRSDPVVFLFHGWTQDSNIGWYELMKNAFFVQNSRWQVVEIDWGYYAKTRYFIAQHHAKPIGFIIGEFIASLTTNYSIPLENILIVGHSMGGQVVAFTGKKFFELVGKRVPRIIALDPAGPLFEGKGPEDRLCPTDAEFVHVIHTDSGVLGYTGNCGAIDFRPNEGSAQPGCVRETFTNVTQISDFRITCSHHRSWWYFIEGIQAAGRFISEKCSVYIPGISSTSCTNETEEMCSLTTDKTGAFFLDTNSKSPFSKT